MKRDEATKTLEEGIAKLGEAIEKGRSEELTNYLRFMSRFHQYSFGNLMLILMQRPDAEQVAGIHAWNKLGRKVKKGAKGIGIIAPCTYKQKEENGDGTEEPKAVVRGFKVVHVFDVTDTEGDDLPELASIAGDPGDNLAQT